MGDLFSIAVQDPTHIRIDIAKTIARYVAMRSVDVTNCIIAGIYHSNQYTSGDYCLVGLNIEHCDS